MDFYKTGFFLQLHDYEKMLFGTLKDLRREQKSTLTVWFAKIKTKLKQFFFLIGFYIPS